jgi:4'-phosphopantetheinyl transferase
MSNQQQLFFFHFEANPTPESLSCLSLVHATDAEDNLWLSYLSSEEEAVYESYKHPSRKKSYLLGRYCAKEAVRSLTGVASTASFSIVPGAFHQPLIRGLPQNGLSVSLSHSHNSAAALAYFDYYACGIDIEKIGPSAQGVLKSIITSSERDLLLSLSLTQEEQLTLLWSAKESLTKALKTGLTLPLSFLEICSIIDKKTHYDIFYKHFPQYSAINFISNEMMISIAKPKTAVIHELKHAIYFQSIR